MWRPGCRSARVGATARALEPLVIASVLALVACGPETPRERVSPGAPVILISIDTLRSDRLPAYGYAGVETPAIDALRSDGILFENAYTHYPLTLPSHVSILSGRRPDQHGIRDNLGYSFASSAEPYLPEQLKEMGYATGGFVSAFVLRSDTGISSGFDFYDDSIAFQEWVPGGALSRRGDKTLDAALPWLRSSAERPFFLFFHIYEPHVPHEAPEPFASRYPDSYDAEVAAADRVVGDLVAELERLGVYDRALLILLSDHGEGLGDHGEQEHGVLLNREIIQVPLIVKLPQRALAGTSVASPAQLVDVLPTVMEVVGGAESADLPGRSLLRLAADEEPRRVYSETFYPRLHYGWSDLASVVEGRYHYIHGPDPELFDLIEDPGETRNIVREERRVFADLRDHLDEYQRELEPPEAVDEATRLKLAALGYLNADFGDRDGPLPDPKTRLGMLADLWQAFDLRGAGKPREAAAAARRALAENPEMTDAWQVLGLSLEDLGQYDEALDAFQHALALSTQQTDLILAASRVRLALGQIDEALEGIRHAQQAGVVNAIALRQIGLQLAEIGRTAEALELLRKMAEDGTTDSLNALARVQSEAGGQRQATATLERVLALDPDNAKAYEHLSLVQLRQQNWVKAEEFSRRALELDDDLSQAWNNLGAALYFLEQEDAALDAWERAVTLDPKEFDALYNLGLRAASAGQFERSRQALRLFIESAPEARYRADIAAAQKLLDQLPG